MRPTQYLIRFVVFTCIVLDPSGTGGGWGIVIGTTLGVIISVVAAGIRRLVKPLPEDEEDE